MDPATLEMLIPLLAVFMGCLIVLIPIAGLTARFAIKPIMEAMARSREIQAGATSPHVIAALESRLAALEQQLQNVEGSVDQLHRASEFDRQLRPPAR